MIFFGITGSFIGAVTYDRREKKKAQKKWCDLVSHLGQDPLPINQMRRKVTVFLSAPPADGLRSTRDYFREYIKPILVAASVDYEVIEGRKEGDVRYGTAESIRRLRRKNGEKGDSTEEPDQEQVTEMQRMRMGVTDEPGPKGDIVIGRHAWKEYVRGLHEGWLGPLDRPKIEEAPIAVPVEEPVQSDPESKPDDTTSDSPAEQPTEEEKKPVDERASLLPTSQYSFSSLASTTPPVFQASAAIPQPHLLGFLNTPIRIYRYLNERTLADKVGRETAAAILAMSTPYQESSPTSEFSSNENMASPTTTPPSSSEDGSTAPLGWEQQSLLSHEEPEWHKSVRKPRADDFERTWLEDVVMDRRIAERMRKSQLDPAEEERAERLVKGEEKPIGWREPKSEEETKILLGNLDDPEA